MAKQKETKTNAMRILESMKIPYVHMTYECDEFIDGLQIADMLSLPYEKVYKTLVTVGSGKDYFVFVIPIAQELNLKAAARSVGQKSVEMIHVKDINKITGYIRGGCTAVGMKKQYVTRIDSSARELEKIIVSGGRIGSQLELAPADLAPADLARAAGAEFADIGTEGAPALSVPKVSILPQKRFPIGAIADIISAAHHLQKFLKSCPIIMDIELIGMAPHVENLRAFCLQAQERLSQFEHFVHLHVMIYTWMECKKL